MKKVNAWILVLLLLFNLIPTSIAVINRLPASSPGGRTSTTWYVSPTGNDRNSGDITHPFHTLRKAINASSNGDTIYMRGGVYRTIRSAVTGIAINRSGLSRSQPFTIMSYPGEHAIFDATGYSFKGAYGILSIGTLTRHQNNVTIQDISFTNSAGEGVTAYSTTSSGSCHDVKILNCSFYNIYGHAIWMYAEGKSTTRPFKNVTVSHCTFQKIQHESGMSEAVTFEYCKNFDFSYNTMTDIKKIFFDAASGSSWGEIHHNNCHMNNTHSGEAIYIDASSYNGQVCSFIRIDNNTIWGKADAGSQNYGIAVDAEVSGGIVHNITIENNVINRSASTRPGNYPYGIGVKGKNPVRDITIKYNTVYISGGTAGPYCSCFYATARNALRIIVANNIFIHKGTSFPCVKLQNYASTKKNFVFYNNLYNRLDGATWTTWFPDRTNKTEAGAIIQDPCCVNVNVGNFHLNSTSPAIDAANPLYKVSADMDGRIRPQNQSYDIGAYEYFTGTGIPPKITNIIITPYTQEMGGYLNISCRVIDNSSKIDEVWVNIIYPDLTMKNYSMNPCYYLNQTYSQIGTYHFLIWAKDTNGNSNLSNEYEFNIIPTLSNALVMGLISDINNSDKSLISGTAKMVLYIRLNPFSINILSSNEHIFVSKDYTGYLGTKIIIGAFKAVVLSGNTSNDSFYHRIINHLK
jgi:hypothetical protein